MKKITGLFISLILMVGCASQPIPAWLDKGFADLERYKSYALIGEEKKTAVYFKRALEEISKSGDLDILARAYLTKCAIEMALLDEIHDGEYLKIEAVQPVAGTKAYHDFLVGSADSADLGRLPDPYRAVIKAYREGRQSDINRTVAGIDDPLSRLVAVGWLVRQKQYDEVLLKTAIETASARGWKKALLVYLKRLQSFYESRKDMGQADHVRKRIELLGH